MDTAGEGEGGGIERVALKHTHYHIEIHSLWDVGASHKELNPVLCDNLGGGMGWEVGRGSGWRGHMYTCGWLMLLYGRNQHKILKQLSSN